MARFALPFVGRQLTDRELEILNGLFPDESVRPRLIVKDHGFACSGQLDSLSPEYFNDLVSRFTACENLAHIGLDGNENLEEEKETLPLYYSDADGRVKLNDRVSGEGIALVMQIFPPMLGLHIQLRLQYELGLMLDRKTTSNDQLDRVGALLDQYVKLEQANHIFLGDKVDARQLAAEAILERYLPAAQEKTALLALEEYGYDLDISSQEHLSPPAMTQDGPKKSRAHPVVAAIRKAFRAVYTWITGIESEETLQEWAKDTSAKVREFDRLQRADRVARRLGMRNRLLAAVFGGLSFITPMLIMAIRPSQVKTLITSSVSVLLFSFGLAWQSSARTETLLEATAAYAAVMVVFVGVHSN